MHTVVGAIFVTFVSSVMIYFYGKNNVDYRSSKTPALKSLSLFKGVYIYLILTTPLIALTSVLVDHPALLEIHHNLVCFYIGMAGAALSVAMFATAMVDLGTNYSPCYDIYIPQDVVRDGVYMYIRHPIYTANICLLAFVFVMTGSFWVFLNWGILTLFYTRSAFIEESALLQKFEDYRHYKQATGMFFPKLAKLRIKLLSSS